MPFRIVSAFLPRLHLEKFFKTPSGMSLRALRSGFHFRSFLGFHVAFPLRLRLQFQSQIYIGNSFGVACGSSISQFSWKSIRKSVTRHSSRQHKSSVPIAWVVRLPPQNKAPTSFITSAPGCLTFCRMTFHLEKSLFAE